MCHCQLVEIQLTLVFFFFLDVSSVQWRNRWLGGLQRLSTGKFVATYREKRDKGISFKNGKCRIKCVKMEKERKRRKIRKNWKKKGKSWGSFFIFFLNFAFHWKFFGAYQNGNFYRYGKNLKSRRKKIGKSDFPPESLYCYVPARAFFYIISLTLSCGLWVISLSRKEICLSFSDLWPNWMFLADPVWLK